MISRSPKPCCTTPGCGLLQAKWTTQPSTCASGSAASMRRCGSMLASCRSSARSCPVIDGVCRNHHGTPFIAGSTTVSAPISGASVTATLPSAGPLTATITRSCTPSACASSAANRLAQRSCPAMRSVSPRSRSACSVAPRASAEIVCAAPAALASARRAAMKPPTAPRPTTAIFMPGSSFLLRRRSYGVHTESTRASGKPERALMLPRDLGRMP